MSTEELRAELPGGTQVLFTDRTNGNMSSVGGEGKQSGALARERLREQIEVSSLARVYQVHGTTLVRAENGSTEHLSQQELPHADGQLSTVPGLGLMVLTADCLPVAIGREGAVAMVHAGWRGLAAGILETAVLALDAIDGSSETVAVIGPGAGACCYEVGPEVHEAFGEHDHESGKMDLRRIARERLLAAGVDRVEARGGCTICDQRYFSYRREGKRAGRMAGVAWLS
jgi:polyphenol oxidase